MSINVFSMSTILVAFVLLGGAGRWFVP